MAEQIRSFWAHLCAMFGAMFGIVVGGTVVTVKSADAAGECVTASNKTDPRVIEWAENEVLSNGAIVDYIYGATAGTRYIYNSTYRCAQEATTSQLPQNRYYVFFRGCASGYYSTGVLDSAAYRSYASVVTSGMIVSNDVGCIDTTTQHDDCRSAGLCVTSAGETRPSTSAIKMACGTTASYAAVKAHFSATPTELTDGLCAKCPQLVYGDDIKYDAVTGTYGTGAGGITGGGISLREVTGPHFADKSWCLMLEAPKGESFYTNGQGDTFIYPGGCRYTE